MRLLAEVYMRVYEGLWEGIGKWFCVRVCERMFVKILLGESV